MREAIRRFQAYSQSTPSGEHLPGVSMPWPLSMRIFIAGFAFRFLTVSYEKSARKARIWQVKKMMIMKTDRQPDVMGKPYCIKDEYAVTGEDMQLSIGLV